MLFYRFLGLFFTANLLLQSTQGEVNLDVGIIHGQNASIKDYPYMVSCTFKLLSNVLFCTFIIKLYVFKNVLF